MSMGCKSGGIGMRRVLLIASLILTGCSGSSSGDVTLYRNSPLDLSLRVHWATFDAPEDVNVNLDNCEMDARILNANASAFAVKSGKPPDSPVGFWCEAGAFKKEGQVPDSFESEFPSDARSPLSF
jgi:hypothetical protein